MTKLFNQLSSPVGLGTLVAGALYPFAWLLELTNCSPCKCRQDSLNKKYPNVTPAIWAMVAFSLSSVVAWLF